MVPLSIILKRSSDGMSSSAVKIGSLKVPVYALIGIGIAIVALLCLSIWLTVRVVRKRATRRREENRISAVFILKGVVKETDLDIVSADMEQTQKKSTGFSRANLTSSIVMPDKAIIRPDATREEIISFYSEQGKLPRPFAPFSFALNASQPSFSPSSSTTMLDKRVSTQSFSASAARPPPSPTRSHDSVLSSVHDSIRESFFGGGKHMRSGSALTAGSRFSVFSTGSSNAGNSNSNSGKGMHQRTVRQTFTPILPDEPTLALGESVSVLKSFDDGWCIVARPKLYGQKGDTELGAVPAWCFVKPMKGLRSERPVRSTSLGVTLQVEDDDRPRDDIISWSNF